MFRASRLQVLAALAVGALGGWLAASGRLNSVLRAEPDRRPVGVSAPSWDGPTPCCEKPTRATEPAAVAAHNRTVQFKAAQDGKKPNILVIMGDDIGWFNPSCYHQGIMGYQTPNIDRIAREGARFAADVEVPDKADTRHCRGRSAAR